MLSELLEFASMDPTPPEINSILATEGYLRGLNDIFERTLLGRRTRIFQPEGTAMQHLQKGFSFFKEWAEELIESGVFQAGVESRKFFMAGMAILHTEYLRVI